jgi:hypothetical protein
MELFWTIVAALAFMSVLPFIIGAVCLLVAVVFKAVLGD